MNGSYIKSGTCDKKQKTKKKQTNKKTKSKTKNKKLKI